MLVSSRLGWLLPLCFLATLCVTASQSTIYFTSFQDNREAVFMVVADGAKPHLLLMNGIDGGFHPVVNAFLAASNRRGTAVVYNEDTAHGTQVFIVKTDASSRRQLTTKDQNYTPGLSPSGKLVVFHSLRDGHREIYLMKADGTGETQVTKTSPLVQNRNASFSPNGKRLIFQSDRSGAWQIYTMKLDGTDVKCLTCLVPSDPGQGTEPAYSADCKFITYVNEKAQICVMHSDGSERQIITNDPHQASRPSFSPDGKIIVYETGRSISAISCSSTSMATTHANSSPTARKGGHRGGRRIDMLPRVGSAVSGSPCCGLRG